MGGHLASLPEHLNHNGGPAPPPPSSLSTSAGPGGGSHCSQPTEAHGFRKGLCLLSMHLADSEALDSRCPEDGKALL